MKKTTKEIILEVSLKHFSSKGYRETTVRAIAKDVGITQSGLYNHFRNKDAILETLIGDLMGSAIVKIFGDRDIETLAKRGKSLLFSIGTTFKLISFDKKNEALFKLLMQELYKNSKVRTTYNEYFYQDNVNKLATVFDIMIQNGQIKSGDSMVLAHEFFSPLFFYQMQVNLLKIDDKPTSSLVTMFEKHVDEFWSNIKLENSKKEDLFRDKSKGWNENSKRVKGAKAIADGILRTLELDNTMHIMDFGAGTGLLSYSLSHIVGKVTAVDNSPSMLEVFREKSSLFGCPTEVLELDLTQDDIPSNILYDGIISSMTIHHVEDIEKILIKMYNILRDDGFISIADLDIENGTFHSNNEGVFHFGFNRDELKEISHKVGFKEIQFETVNTIQKPHRSFSVFLLTAKK